MWLTGQRRSILQQYGPLERLVVVISWIYERLVGWRVRRLLELSHLLARMEPSGVRATRTGTTNVLNVINDPDLGCYSMNLRRNTSDVLAMRQVLVEKEYDVLIQRIRHDGHAGNIRFIVDAGANIGSSTLFFARAFSGATVVCIEPDGGNYQCLLTNIRANGLENVTALQAALWVDNSRLAVDRSFRDSREWSIAVTPAADRAGDSIEGVTVADLMVRYGQKSIDILKIDIEGAERVVFASRETVRMFLPFVRYLLMEVHHEFDVKPQVTKLLDEFGFTHTFFGELLVAANGRFAQGSPG